MNDLEIILGSVIKNAKANLQLLNEQVETLKAEELYGEGKMYRSISALEKCIPVLEELKEKFKLSEFNEIIDLVWDKKVVLREIMQETTRQQAELNEMKELMRIIS